MSPPDEVDSTGVLCPSGRCADDAIALGVVGADGRVGYLSPLLRIDEQFMAVVREGRVPEKRFRFAEPCVEGRCAQWRDGRCGVIDRAAASLGDTLDPAQADLPRCSIRPHCRWFHQLGRNACLVCPWVITDLRAPRSGDQEPTGYPHVHISEHLGGDDE